MTADEKRKYKEMLYNRYGNLIAWYHITDSQLDAIIDETEEFNKAFSELLSGLIGNSKKTNENNNKCSCDKTNDITKNIGAAGKNVKNPNKDYTKVSGCECNKISEHTFKDQMVFKLRESGKYTRSYEEYVSEMKSIISNCINSYIKDGVTTVGKTTYYTRDRFIEINEYDGAIQYNDLVKVVTSLGFDRYTICETSTKKWHIILFF